MSADSQQGLAGTRSPRERLDNSAAVRGERLRSP
jgi:hypothetical protein